jgi:HK97 family phage major capsid protein
VANPLLDLLQRRDSYRATATSILDKAETEGRNLTAAETKDLQNLRQKIDGVKSEIEAREYFAAGNEIFSGDRGRGAQPMFDSLPGADVAPGGRRVMAASEVRGHVFGNLGEQLSAVIQAGSHGGRTDPRLHSVMAVATGANEGVGSEGGFLLEPGFSYALLEGAMSAAKLAPRCSPFPMPANSNSLSLPMVDEKSRVNGSRFGGLQLYWAGEGETLTPSKPKFRKLELKLGKLTGLFYLTDELVQDARVLGAFIDRAFQSEFSFVIDDNIMRGPGAGRPLGFLQSGALVTVPKESGQAADTIETDNILKMFMRQHNPERAIWLVNKDCFSALATLSYTVGTTGTLVGLLQQGVANSPTGFAMLGRPVVWLEQASTLGDVGDVCFVDMSHYLLATKGGLQSAFSAHVRFLQDEGVMRFTFRLDGQPDLASPITPANGTSTQSPFVTLAARA